MFNKNKPGITVVVKNGRWDAFGDLTKRSQWLLLLLQAKGGVNEGVLEGTYTFNAVRRGMSIEMTLLPVE